MCAFLFTTKAPGLSQLKLQVFLKIKYNTFIISRKSW